MKLFICLFALLAVASADSGYYYAAPQLRNPLLLSSFSSSLSNAIQQQYHSQDELGQYSYGYTEPLSSKQEVRTLDGVTRGSYSYIDAAGKVQTVDYTADAGGFRVAATNLPRPLNAAPLEAPKSVEYTPEVAAARAQHLAAHRLATLRSSGEVPIASERPISVASSSYDLPQPVEDTVEVAAAKKEFFQLYEQEQLRHKLLHAKQAAAYSLVKSHPIVAAFALPSYQTGFPNGGFHYKLAVPALSRAYIPVA